MRVLDLMAIDVVTVRPETTLKEAARLMVDQRISGLPVTDADGVLVGILTEADFVARHAGQAQSGGMLAGSGDQPSVPTAGATVADAMTTDPVVIFAEANVAEAARLMAEYRVKRLPVVDDANRVVGIMSRADIVNAFTRPDDLIEDEVRVDILDRIFEASDIEIEVDEGVVTVHGALTDAADHDLLLELIRRLEGVVDVRSGA